MDYVTVGDLRRELEGLEDSVLVAISDGHEGVSRMRTHKGFWPVLKDDDGEEYAIIGYVSTLERCKENYPKAARYVPAIQIDTDT
jgi:hypothetical protein